MPTPQNFDTLLSSISRISRTEIEGKITRTTSNIIEVKGLDHICKVGDLVRILPENAATCFGEVLSLRDGIIQVFPENGVAGLALDTRVRYYGTSKIMPHASWIGRIIDPFLRPLDQGQLINGDTERQMKADPPAPTERKLLGARMATGLAAIDTMLPLVRGQRTGIFAGSGVGKSTLLADFAKGTEADIVVISLVGERGRELREFVEDTLGPDGMKKAIIIVATSDRPAMVRRRAAWVAMAIAEHFRDQGQQVLFLMDSITRFAEAHREIAVGSGESAALRGFPTSTFQELMSLCERAGPGAIGQGDITAIFSVLVEGSDMEGPIADTVRGLLDGHLVLTRQIAERGRFPAIDLIRSISRSLPKAATITELEIINRARELASAYSEVEVMIQAGLYDEGSSEVIDQAIRVRPKLENFLSKRKASSISDSFAALDACLST